MRNNKQQPSNIGISHTYTPLTRTTAWHLWPSSCSLSLSLSSLHVLYRAPRLHGQEQQKPISNLPHYVAYHQPDQEPHDIAHAQPSPPHRRPCRPPQP